MMITAVFPQTALEKVLLTSLVSDGRTIVFRHASQNRQINASCPKAMN